MLCPDCNRCDRCGKPLDGRPFWAVPAYQPTWYTYNGTDIQWTYTDTNGTIKVGETPKA